MVYSLDRPCDLMPFGKPPDQAWSAYIRQMLSFVLGGAVVIRGIIQKGANVPELVVGLLLMGVVPVDAVLNRLGVGKKTDGEFSTGSGTATSEATPVGSTSQQPGG